MAFIGALTILIASSRVFAALRSKRGIDGIKPERFAGKKVVSIQEWKLARVRNSNECPGFINWECSPKKG